jgi:hypothetical protein
MYVCIARAVGISSWEGCSQVLRPDDSRIAASNLAFVGVYTPAAARFTKNQPREAYLIRSPSHRPCYPILSIHPSTKYAITQ